MHIDQQSYESIYQLAAAYRGAQERADQAKALLIQEVRSAIASGTLTKVAAAHAAGASRPTVDKWLRAAL